MKKSLLILTLILAVFVILPACSGNTDKTTEQTTPEKTVYACPMKCEGEKTYDQPGKCPECEMPTEKVVAKTN